jgi:hypothetical protein
MFGKLTPDQLKKSREQLARIQKTLITLLIEAQLGAVAAQQPPSTARHPHGGDDWHHRPPPYDARQPPPRQQPPPRAPGERGPFNAQDGWQRPAPAETKQLPPPPKLSPAEIRAMLVGYIDDLRAMAIHMTNCARLLAQIAEIIEQGMK